MSKELAIGPLILRGDLIDQLSILTPALHFPGLLTPRATEKHPSLTPEVILRRKSCLQDLSSALFPGSVVDITDDSALEVDGTFIQTAQSLLVTANNFYLDPKRIEAPTHKRKQSLYEAVNRLINNPYDYYVRKYPKMETVDLIMRVADLVALYQGWQIKDPTQAFDESNPYAIARTKHTNCIGYVALLIKAITEDPTIALPIDRIRTLLFGYHLSAAVDDKTLENYYQTINIDFRKKSGRPYAAFGLSDYPYDQIPIVPFEEATNIDGFGDTRFPSLTYQAFDGVSLAQLIHFAYAYPPGPNKYENASTLLKALCNCYPENKFIHNQLVYHASYTAKPDEQIVY